MQYNFKTHVWINWSFILLYAVRQTMSSLPKSWNLTVRYNPDCQSKFQFDCDISDLWAFSRNTSLCQTNLQYRTDKAISLWYSIRACQIHFIFTTLFESSGIIDILHFYAGMYVDGLICQIYACRYIKSVILIVNSCSQKSHYTHKGHY
jgi:hypothetical protein